MQRDVVETAREDRSSARLPLVSEDLRLDGRGLGTWITTPL
jgi:hypothetical protein